MRNCPIRGCLIALVFVIGVGEAFASKKVHPKLSNDQTEIQNPDAKELATLQPPIIVNVSPPQKTQNEIEQEAKGRDEKTDNDRKLVEFTHRLADYTLGLFIATGFLVVATAVLGYLGWRQAREMKKSLAIAKKTADAALKSANVAEQSLLMAETPCLVPEVTTKFIGIDENRRYVINHAAPQFTYRFKNFGRTPAFIRRINYAVVPVDKINPVLKDISHHPDSQGADTVPSNGGVSIDYSHNMLIDDIAALIEKRRDAFTFSIIFSGDVRYDDVFGNEYVKDFLLIRNETTGEFIPGAKEYNLMRRSDEDKKSDESK
jgi:hypothetical protein